MSRRAPRREPSVYDIHASLGVAASEPLVLSLLLELIKHLQYSRGQCCQLVDRLEAFCKAAAAAQAESKRKRTPTEMRRVSKYMQQVSSQVEALQALPLEALLQLRAPVAILLGPSPLRPKEVYLVRFFAGGGSAGGSGSMGPATGCPGAPSGQQQLSGGAASCPKEVASAGKRLLRSVIVQGAAIEEWVDIAAATKMFLMVQAPASCQAELAGFLPRRGFALNLRKAFQVNIEIQLAPGPLQGTGACAASRAQGTHTGHRQRDQQQHHLQRQEQEQSLEEQLETSMQLCDSDDDDMPQKSQQQQQQQQQEEERVEEQQQQQADVAGSFAEGPAVDGDELLWFQCVHVVKGMRQPEG